MNLINYERLDFCLWVYVKTAADFTRCTVMPDCVAREELKPLCFIASLGSERILWSRI